jgi:hypothetical protein
MKPRVVTLCALLGVVVGAFLSACNQNAIGRACVNPGGQQVAGTQLSFPALECPSRLCLIEPVGAANGNIVDVDGGVRATCTARCDHDSDCEAETNDLCGSGFVCAIATDVGDFCCQKLCMCRDDLQPGKNVDVDGNTITPLACTPGNSSCVNVE